MKLKENENQYKGNEKMIKACIFDLDGTLAYTLDSMAVVGNEVVRKYGLKPMPIEN